MVIYMEINVMSFNIRCCDDADGHSIPERAPRLANIFSKYECDIIGLQEVRFAWEPHLSEIFSEDYDMFLKYRNETEDIEAAAILWRRDKYDCIKTGCFWLSDTPDRESRGWDELYNCYRICIYAVLSEKASGKRFVAMCTHFGFGDSGQVKSARLIYNYSKEISNLPTFIVGDFNMKPDSAGYGEMLKNFTDVNAATVRDFGTTYHNYAPDKITDEHIDYCFVDKNIVSKNQKIVRDTVDGKFPSDHYPVYSVLKI